MKNYILKINKLKDLFYKINTWGKKFIVNRNMNELL